METEFTPVMSLIGGIMIGAASLMFFLLNGRIAGISGIVSRLLPPERNNASLESALFVVGLLAAWPLYMFFAGEAPSQKIFSNTTGLIAAGLVVGVGTVLGSGCTSGHGVCGISRLSFRSIVATGTFMCAAFVTVYVMRHVWGG